MINRKQFQQQFNSYRQGLGDRGSALWEPERYNYHKPSRWFINIHPIDSSNKEFWDWANKNCRGQILCYSSDSDGKEEWWGFTHRRDVTLFLLRWA